MSNLSYNGRGAQNTCEEGSQILRGSRKRGRDSFFVRTLYTMRSLDIRIAEPVDRQLLHYVAAAPPDRNASFTGSALPFASARQAFHATPTQGTARVSADGTCRVALPSAINAFYTDAGATRVPPTVFLMYHSGGRERRRAVRVSGGVAYRSLTYPAERTSPMFYGERGALLPVRTQDQILAQAQYPSNGQEATGFWGLRPPV